MTSPKRSRRATQSGMTLIESIVAVAILLIVSSGMLALAIVATLTTENQGHLGARTTEYAQDKMEQLLGLAYGDSISDTTQATTATSGGTGLTISSGGGTTSDPKRTVALCGAHLDVAGNPLTSRRTTPPSASCYKRPLA